MNASSSPVHNKPHHVVIVGGGFAGVACAQGLAGQKGFQVTLIDRRNYHLFQPLLYQVAMAGLNPGDISIPLRKLFSGISNINILMAEVEGLSPENKTLQYEGRHLHYDTLVLCCGAKHFYFGNDGWEEYAPGLKNIEQATEIRRRVLMALELAEKEEDPTRRQHYMSFAVIGGGPTGVEMAGAIAEMVKHTLTKDYQRADLKQARVHLLEGGDRLLAGFPAKLSQATKESLQALGVEVRLNAHVTNINEVGLEIGDEKLKAHTKVWAAGVRPSRLSEQVPGEKDKQGRVLVTESLHLPDNHSIFVLGDQAATPDGQGNVLPGLAPVALQQGQFVAKLLRSELKDPELKKSRPSFRYRDKGIMATIGRNRAVAAVGSLHISGSIAWLMWVFVHIVFLMKFKNRFFVFMQWVWAYFSFGRGARLIVHKTWRFYDGKKIPIQASDPTSSKNSGDKDFENKD